jgi:hypothetical protein
MVVFVDGNPGMNLQADLMAVLKRGGETVEMGIILNLHHVAHRRALLGRQVRRKALEGLSAGVGLRVPEIVLIPVERKIFGVPKS